MNCSKHPAEGQSDKMEKTMASPDAAANEQKSQGDDKAQAKSAGQTGKKAGARKLSQLWYEQKHREIVVYYLIAVFCVELIVGTIAFFYGVTNAEPLVAGGPKMARFPWIGWLVASVLAPVGLLLLLHLSGQFFSGVVNGQESGGGGGGEGSEQLPKSVQRMYTIIRHAPTIVILLGLVCLGCAVLFLDSAMGVVLSIGAALKPHLLWIICGIVVFLVLTYLGRMWFISRHKRMEQEYAYRMKVLETTGIVIMNKGCVPLRYEEGQLKLLAQNEDGQLKALPEQQAAPDSAKDDIEDATVVSK